MTEEKARLIEADKVKSEIETAVSDDGGDARPPGPADKGPDHKNGERIAAAGDRFAIMGYRTESGYCYDDELKIIFEIVKDFEERYDSETRRTINGLAGEGGTPSGAALENASAKLAAVNAKNRIIIHLTDGMPDDSLLAGIGASEVRDAVKIAAARGIKTFCVTINPKMHGHMDKMYAAGNWVLVSDIEKLPIKLIKFYKRLLS